MGKPNPPVELGTGHHVRSGEHAMKPSNWDHLDLAEPDFGSLPLNLLLTVAAQCNAHFALRFWF